MDDIRRSLKNAIDMLNEEDLKELQNYISFLKNKEKETVELIAFFEHMQKYALHDLEQLLLRANYDNSGFGRFAVSIAQSVFSLLDLFEYLISEKNELLDTRGNIDVSLKHFFSNEINQLQRSILIDIYRNGVMHSYFPKMCSIRNANDEKILIQNGNSWDLNVNPISKLLIERLIGYMDNSKKDSKTLFHLTQRYSKFTYHQEKAFEKYRDNLSKRNLEEVIFTTTRPV